MGSWLQPRRLELQTRPHWVMTTHRSQQAHRALSNQTTDPIQRTYRTLAPTQLDDISSAYIHWHKL